MDERAIVWAVLDQYSLSLYGAHGLTHWARVLENGVRLATQTGANQSLVRLFAMLHDGCRVNEFQDAEHGPRAAELVQRLHGRYFSLCDDELELLLRACHHHTDGREDPDITVQTCWDADRLDLGRVGITPDPARLCTEAAKALEIRDWADKRAFKRFKPDIVDQWLAGATGRKRSQRPRR